MDKYQKILCLIGIVALVLFGIYFKELLKSTKLIRTNNYVDEFHVNCVGDCRIVNNTKKIKVIANVNENKEATLRVIVDENYCEIDIYPNSFYLSKQYDFMKNCKEL